VVEAFWLGARTDSVSGYPRASELCIPLGEFIPPSQVEHNEVEDHILSFSSRGLMARLWLQFLAKEVLFRLCHVIR